MSTDIAPGAAHSAGTSPNAEKVHAALRRVMFTQWIMLLLFLGVVIGLLGYKAMGAYRETGNAERAHLLTQARALSNSLDEQMLRIYRALSYISGQSPTLARGYPVASLKATVSVLHGVRTINVLDRNGIAIASNRDELIGKNFSGRDYFNAAISITEPGRAALSAPFKTVLDAWGINIALPIRGPDNVFAGVVTATLDKEYFESLLGASHYAPDMRSSVIHSDGILFTIVPAQPGLEGKNLAQPGAYFTQHLQSGHSENVYSGTTYATGEQRMVALVTVPHPLTDRGLVVAVTRDLNTVFAGWQRDTVVDAALLLILSIISITSLVLYQRRQITTAKHDAHSANQLLQSNARFRAIFDASPVPFALNDEQQNITHLNAAFTRTFGYTIHDIPTLADWWPRAYPDAEYQNWVAMEWAAHLLTAQREHQPFVPMELNICCKDGATRTALVGAAPLGDAFVDIHLVVLYDITERKAADVQRERLQAQLRQAQKMEAVGQLTGGIAHDFNNILASILGYSELLREQMPQAADYKSTRYLDQIQRAGERARDLIAKMLTFARGTTSAPRALDPCAAIHEIINLLGPTLPPTIRIEVDIDAEIPTICADPVQLHQIVANLLINARDALPGTGRIRVGLYRARAQDATCNACGNFFGGEFFTLSVSDNGSGIPPETLPHIFNPFYTTKEINKGTGLGLSVVHGIVHELGGHILVDSSAASGTTFRVLVPTVSIPAEPHAGLAPPQAPDLERTPK